MENPIFSSGNEVKIDNFKSFSKDDIIKMQARLMSLRSYAGMSDSQTVGELSAYLTNKLNQFPKIEESVQTTSDPSYDASGDMNNLSNSILELARLDPNLTIRSAVEALARESFERD